MAAVNRSNTEREVAERKKGAEHRAGPDDERGTLRGDDNGDDGSTAKRLRLVDEVAKRKTVLGPVQVPAVGDSA